MSVVELTNYYLSELFKNDNRLISDTNETKSNQLMEELKVKLSYYEESNDKLNNHELVCKDKQEFNNINNIIYDPDKLNKSFTNNEANIDNKSNIYNESNNNNGSDSDNKSNSNNGLDSDNKSNSNNESDSDNEERDSLVITEKYKNIAKKLYNFIETERKITELFNKNDLERANEFLSKIINHKNHIKISNPYVYCSYIYDGYGYFCADTVTTMSYLIANILCKSYFYYSDVLGKHSELDFTIDDVKWEICDKDEKYGKDYELNMENPHINYEDNIFYTLLEELENYMDEHYHLLPNDFNVKYQELINIGNAILENLIKTNDPIIQISFKTELSYKKEIIHKIYLSDFLTLYFTDYLIPLQSDNFFPINKTTVSTPKNMIINYGSIPQIKNCYFNINSEKLILSHKKITTILNSYKASNPIQFIELNFDNIMSSLSVWL